MKPTGECLGLLPAARELVYWSGQYRMQASAVRGVERGRIVLGNAYDNYYRWLSAVIASFRAAYPGIDVSILGGTSSELCRTLEDRRADFCIISRRDGAHEWIHLKYDELVPRTHPLAGRAALPLKTFEEEPFIEILPGAETDNSRLFHRQRIRPNVQMSCGDSLSACRMVEGGLGLTIVNSLLAEGLRGDVAILPLDPPQLVDVGIAVRSLDASSPAVRAFVACARQSVAD